MQESKFLINDVKLIQLPCFPDATGNLVVLEGESPVPFAIARVFAVQASAGAIRGQHAHKACTQFLTCLHGSVEIRCEDGLATSTYVLDQAGKGLLVPPGIWAECHYQAADSVLMVLCNRHYEDHDYIRNHHEFKEYRRQ